LPHKKPSSYKPCWHDDGNATAPLFQPPPTRQPTTAYWHTWTPNYPSNLPKANTRPGNNWPASSTTPIRCHGYYKVKSAQERPWLHYGPWHRSWMLVHKQSWWHQPKCWQANIIAQSPPHWAN